MRRWFGPTAGHPGSRHYVQLIRDEQNAWSLSPQIDGTSLILPAGLGAVPYYSDLRVACGLAKVQEDGHDQMYSIHVRTSHAINEKKHFVIQASGDSMNGTDSPINDGDLVLCEWASVSDPAEIEGEAALLIGESDQETTACLKIPVRKDGVWHLRSQNPEYADDAIPGNTKLSVVARALEVVEELRPFELWGQYHRDAIAEYFGQPNNPSWKVGHRDVEIGGNPHTVLMVNLRKPKGTRLEHRYADRFITSEEFQWESQASTSTNSLKAKRIIKHAEENRFIHLFVRYLTKDKDGKAEPYTYCGTLKYLRHESERPIRVWFNLNSPLPETLWDAWS